MTRTGYIKFYRKALDSWLWELPPGQFKVAMTILLSTNWLEGQAFSGGKVVRVERGQLMTSLQSLAQASGQSVRTVRTTIHNLWKAGFLTNESTSRFRLLSLVNFDYYQSPDKEPDKEPDKPATSQRQASDNDIRREEGKKGKKPKRSTASQPAADKQEHTQFVSIWTDLYKERYGEAPTWGGKQGAIVKRLLKAKGFDALCRKAKAVLKNPPQWVSGGVDLGFLESNWDKLVTPRSGNQQKLKLLS